MVPFAAGGSVDIVGRLVAQKLTERLGKPFIVENRPGAGTATATTAVAKSAPDGHTLLFAPSGTFAINPTLYKQLAYDPLKDLTMVALVTRDPLVLVVNPSLPVNSVADLVKYAKDNPGKVSFAATGAGTSLTLLGELLKSIAKIDIVSVNYRGGAQGLQDVIAGQVHMMFSDPASGVVQAQAGKVRALGVSSATRLAVAPDIPTITRRRAAVRDRVRGKCWRLPPERRRRSWRGSTPNCARCWRCPTSRSSSTTAARSPWSARRRRSLRRS